MLLGPPESNWCFSFAPELVSFRRPGISIVGQLTESVESSFSIHYGVNNDLSVCS